MFLLAVLWGDLQIRSVVVPSSIHRVADAIAVCNRVRSPSILPAEVVVSGLILDRTPQNRGDRMAARPIASVDIEAVVGDADRALRAAKNQGRDRTVMSADP